MIQDVISQITKSLAIMGMSATEAARAMSDALSGFGFIKDPNVYILRSNNWRKMHGIPMRRCQANKRAQINKSRRTHGRTIKQQKAAFTRRD